MKIILSSWKIILLFKYNQSIFFIAQIQGVLYLGCFLRRWKNKRVSRKPCKGRSDLVLKGQMRVPKNKQCYFENHVVREPCKRRTVCTFKINKRTWGEAYWNLYSHMFIISILSLYFHFSVHCKNPAVLFKAWSSKHPCWISDPKSNHDKKILS